LDAIIDSYPPAQKLKFRGNGEIDSMLQVFQMWFIINTLNYSEPEDDYSCNNSTETTKVCKNTMK